MSEKLHLACLGGLEIAQGGAPLTGFVSTKVQALLCYLAVTGRPHLRPALAGLLWGGMTGDRANANLRKALSNLRKLVGDHLLVDNQSIAFDPDSAHWLDVEAFRQQIEAELHPGDEPLSSEAAAALARAAALYRGDFLAGFYVRDAPDFEEWALAERERLRELTLRVLSALADYHAARAENEQAIGYASRLLALDPWREEIHRQMMRLLARNGQRSAALAQYETCRRVLAEELGVEPMSETTALYERIRAASTRPVHLPPQPTPFVGRQAELARVSRCFDDPACRLLTLVGPGGIGKTRLALEVAASRQLAFLDGVYFVPLSGVVAPEMLVPALADALHFSFYSQQDLQVQLLAFLREKEILLLLDSFEHLLAGAELLAEILEQAPQVKLLVTSRQRLNLRWEWLFDVPGLPYPQHEVPQTAMADLDAVQLFVQTARRIEPGFSLEEQGTWVVEICRLVEGMPLGIELAAAALRERSCQEIADEITRNLAPPATSLRDVPERHRSLQAAFEGSWRLLSRQEQEVFGRLSVFCGGFDPEAARQVTGASRFLLDGLLNKSLLRKAAPLPAAQQQSGRHEMHELLRQFAAEKLAGDPQAGADIQARHADYYATFLQRRADALRGGRQPETLASIAGEIENVRAAWLWAAGQRRFDLLARALEGAYRFYNIRGWLQEGLQILVAAAASLEQAGSESLLGRVLVRQSWLYFRLGSFDRVREPAERGLALARRLGDRREEAFAVAVLGALADEQGAYDEAQALFQASLALYEGVDDRFGLAWVWERLGDLGRMVGAYDEAHHYYARCLAFYQEVGDRNGLAAAYNSLGSAAGTRGEYEQARAYFERSLAICRELGDRFGIARAGHNLGSVVYIQGHYAEAKRLRQETLAICREIGFRWGVANSMRHLGDACRRLGEYDEARRLYQEGMVLEQEVGHQRGVALALSSLGGLAQALGAYDQARAYYHRALQAATEIESSPVVLAILSDWAELLAREGQGEQALALLCFVQGQPATEQQIRDQIAGLMADLQAGIGSPAATAARIRGRTWTLEEVVARLLDRSTGNSFAG